MTDEINEIEANIKKFENILVAHNLVEELGHINILEINNFKSIKHIKFECKKINILIGEPNTGKSNILESIGIFSVPYDELKSFIRFENMTNLFYNQDISKKVDIRINDSRFEMISLLNKDKGQPEFIGKIKEDRAEKEVFGFKYDYYGQGMTSRCTPIFFGKIKFYQFKTLDKFQKFEQDFLLPPNGKNLLSIFLKNDTFSKSIINLLDNFGYKIVLRSHEDKIEVQKEVGGVIISIPYSLISDTIRRIVFYLAIIESNYDSIIILEEPESHSFPFYTRFLAEVIALDKYNQYFISTHNPYFLSSILEKTPIKDIGIFLTYFEDDQTKIKKISEQDLPKILDLESSVFFNLEKFLND